MNKRSFRYKMGMKKETKIKVGVGIAVGVTAAVAATKAVMDVMSDVTVAKDLPPAATKVKKVLTDKLIDDDAWKAAKELAKTLEKRPHEEVVIHNRDGLKLYGHWFECKNAKRVVILFHGWRSSWSTDFSPAVPFFEKEGCSLLLVEQRSHGKSEGEYIGFGVYERFDCLDWIEYAESRANGLPIYLCGISMGASTVLMASGLGIPTSVHGIIADCGFTSPRAIWAHVIKKNAKINETLSYPLANYFISKRAGYRGEDASTLDAMKVCRVPILFVHGDADGFVPLSMTEQNYEACASDKTLLVVKGADHGTSYIVDPESYENHVREFFAKNDGKDSYKALQ